MTWPREEAAAQLIVNVPYDSEIELAQLAEVHCRIVEDQAGQTARVPGPEAMDQVRRAILGGCL